jgi:hypothetical protein
MLFLHRMRAICSNDVDFTFANNQANKQTNIQNPFSEIGVGINGLKVNLAVLHWQVTMQPCRSEAGHHATLQLSSRSPCHPAVHCWATDHANKPLCIGRGAIVARHAGVIDDSEVDRGGGLVDKSGSQGDDLILVWSD